MTSLWSRWVGICTEREHGRTQAWFRIALGTVVLWDLLGALRSDARDLLYLAAADGGLTSGRRLHWLVELLGGQEPAVVQGMFVAAAVAAAAVTLGLGGRWSALTLLQLLLAIRSLSSYASGGYDLVIANGLWLLVLSSATATHSRGCRLRSGGWSRDRRGGACPR